MTKETPPTKPVKAIEMYFAVGFALFIGEDMGNKTRPKPASMRAEYCWNSFRENS